MSKSKSKTLYAIIYQAEGTRRGATKGTIEIRKDEAVISPENAAGEADSITVRKADIISRQRLDKDGKPVAKPEANPYC